MSVVLKELLQLELTIARLLVDVRVVHLESVQEFCKHLLLSFLARNHIGVLLGIIDSLQIADIYRSRAISI